MVSSLGPFLWIWVFIPSKFSQVPLARSLAHDPFSLLLFSLPSHFGRCVPSTQRVRVLGFPLSPFAHHFQVFCSRCFACTAATIHPSHPPSQHNIYWVLFLSLAPLVFFCLSLVFGNLIITCLSLLLFIYSAWSSLSFLDIGLTFFIKFEKTVTTDH